MENITIKKWVKTLSLVMAFILCLGCIPVSAGISADAASKNISSLPTVIKSYPVSTGNDTPAYASKGATSKSGTIYATDLCTIQTIYSDGYLRVSYPVSGGKTRTLYVKSNAFFKGTTYQTASITKKATAYRRSSGSATIGSVDSADKLVYVIGNAVNGRYQIVYKVTGTSTWKLGWVTTSAVKINSNTSAPANNSSTSNFSPVWPCSSAYNVTCMYYYKDGSKHSTSYGYKNGIDISGGGTIVAVEKGIVEKVVNLGNKSYGKYIVILHDNGVRSLYAHLSSFAVSEGSPVKRGQLIGMMGSSGNSSGTHLHFEMSNCDPFMTYYKSAYRTKIKFESNVRNNNSKFNKDKAIVNWIDSNYRKSGNWYIAK